MLKAKNKCGKASSWGVKISTNRRVSRKKHFPHFISENRVPYGCSW